VDRRHDLVQIAVLREARSGTSGLERLKLAGVGRRGQADDRHFGTGFPQFRCHLDAVGARKAVVHEDDVRLVAAAEGDNVAPVVRRGHDLDVRAEVEQQLERLAEDVVVLHEGDADYRAFWTFPALRQRVHTYARVGFPWRTTRTRWRFGSKRRFVATIEWLRL
jgi:hypothetical protein